MKKEKAIKTIFTIIEICFVILVFIVNNNTVYGADDGASGGGSRSIDNPSWVEGAKDFISNADSNITIESSSLNKPSSEIYNILTSFGMIVALAVGIVLGIKYMIAGADEKAEVKETLLPYIIGCVVTFGAFGIWKILINTFIGIS